jgi:predicted pyridoxine 5'-phosphate oxidase superfamily flavin-nucleotide-binding protein|tara:strand:+ start:166 stop:543 length:378 start_codon:yes stop_codon:yes gene_type:complete
MSALPQAFLDAWDQHEPRMILTTVNKASEPNAVWVLCVNKLDDKRILIANNFFNKTLENILAGSHGSLLMIAPEREAYQIKGALEYHTDGPIYNDMKAWLDPKFAGVGAVILNIESIYYGAEKII